MYMLARLNGSTNIVECGTSFGVSTLYFALAVSHNLGIDRTKASGVITIEKDTEKVKAAQEIWTEAGDEVKERISSRQGDLLEILAEGTVLPHQVDLLFLDGNLPKSYLTHMWGLKFSSMDLTCSPSSAAGVAKTKRGISSLCRQDCHRQDIV
jgi:predicted O-methyltransferase YrrM